MESINQVFDSAVRFNSVPITILNYSRPASVEWQNIEYSNGTINLAISGVRPEDIFNYVLRLQKTEHFKKISYAGYNYNETEEKYFANIQCVLQGGL